MFRKDLPIVQEQCSKKKKKERKNTNFFKIMI